MFYQPEIIVYLWLLPVTLMIVIPAALAVLLEVRGIAIKKAEKKEYIPDHGAFAHA